MANNTGWHRRSFVSRGPDPTEVVVWSKGGQAAANGRPAFGDLEIMEFQGVYTVNGGWAESAEFVAQLGEELHKSLERPYQEQEEKDGLAQAADFDNRHREGYCPEYQGPDPRD